MTKKVDKQKCFSAGSLKVRGLPKKWRLGQYADLRMGKGAWQERGGWCF